MSDIPFILTAAGAAALVNAANNGTDPVIISHCGVSPTAFAASAATTALTGELKRVGTLSGDVVEADTIHVVVRDETADVYSLRSLGLYTGDGTLFAVYSQPAVIMEKSAGAMLLLAIDAKFAGVDAALISFGDTNFLNPPATEARQGVIEIATQAEAHAGNDDERALTAKKAKAAILGWLLAQDGAGSGLDADLLDGLNSDYFTNIPARLGFTPLNALLYTAADVLAKLLTVDGAGSGVDADMLDGQQGNYYTNITARLGFIPLNAANYTAADVLAKLLTVDGAGSGTDADLLDGQQGSYYADIPARLGFTPAATAYLGNADLNTAIVDGIYRVDIPTNGPTNIWFGQLLVMRGHRDTVTQILSNFETADLWVRTGNPPNIGGLGGWTPWKCLVSATGPNSYSAADVLAKLVTVDGSGSGLDADLLDGAQLSELVKKTDFSQSLVAGGYQILPGGLCLQWVRGAYGFNESTQSLTWPIAFTQVFEAFPCVSTPSASTSADVWFQLVGSAYNTGCEVMRAYSGNTGSVGATPIVFAIGKINP